MTRTPACPRPARTDLARAAWVALAALCAGCGSTGGEKDAPYHWPRLSLAAGGQVFAGFDTDIRVDSEALGTGTEIDFEDDLDFEETVYAGRIDLDWNWARRHGVELSYFDLRRSGTRTIDRELQIGDEVFPIDARVNSSFDTLVAKLSYRYSILREQRWHAGLSLGLHVIDMDMEWNAGSLGLKEDFGAAAPLPVVGFFGAYAFTPELYLSGVSEFFALEYEEYDGFLNDSRLVLEHRTFEHFAFGLGLAYYHIDAGVESERDGLIEAELESGYLGVMAFVRLY